MAREGAWKHSPDLASPLEISGALLLSPFSALTSSFPTHWADTGQTHIMQKMLIPFRFPKSQAQGQARNPVPRALCRLCRRRERL